MQAFTREAEIASPHNPSHYKTSDLEEEYNGMLVQSGDSEYDAQNDPYRDFRMKAVKQRAMAPPKEKVMPAEGAYNSFTREDNAKAQPKIDYESMAQAKNKFADHWEDKRHSQVWNDRVATESKALNNQMNYITVMEHRKHDPHYPDYYAGANEESLENEYNGMLVQENYQDGYTAPYARHSPYFYAHESEVVHELAQEAEQKEQEVKARADEAAAKGLSVDEMGQEVPEKHFKNTSLDYEEVWGGSVLLQLDDHLNDEDDIVPELNEAVQIKRKSNLVEVEKKKDFAGEDYEEFYDE